MVEWRTPLHKRVVEVLKITSTGMTARQMSWQLGREVGEVSSLMSKMALYGALERDKPKPGHFIYRLPE